MRKRIAAFLCMMMVFTMTTGVAMAMVIDEKGQHNSNEYEVPFTGSSSKIWARATDYFAYTTLENTSNASKYLTCQVMEYTVNDGWTNSNASSGLKLHGAQVNTQISRDAGLVGYYFYGGYCYNDQSCSWVIDDYTYKGYQGYIPQ